MNLNRGSVHGPSVWAAVCTLWWASTSAAGVADPQDPDAVLEPVEVTAERRPQPATADDCDFVEDPGGMARVAQDLLRGASCHTFRWFDGLFGDTHDFDESAVKGLMTVGAEYTEYDNLDARLRFRVHAPLPNLSRRYDVLVGRVDEDTYVRDTQPQDTTFYNPGLVPRGDDSEWLLGLGHRRKNPRGGWDWSVGVRLESPPDPYVKTQYYFNQRFTPDTDLRFRQTFFWDTDESFGTTSRGDLTHALGERNVLRWEGVATVSQERDGLYWYAGQTWYHLFEGMSAISLLAFVQGETDEDPPLQEYGVNLIWRRPLEGDWLFLSIGPSLTWPRYEASETRSASWGFGAWIEMEFGDYRY